MKKICLLISCLFVLISLPVLNCTSKNKTPNSDTALGDSAWQNNLEQWLKIAYLENEDDAAFGGMSGDLLKPDLYTTYAISGILSVEGRPIENASDIINWINSLQIEDGSYIDPESRAPALLKTYFAVSVLNRLESVVSETYDVKNFLRNQQQSNKLFYFSDDKLAAESIKDYFWPTLLAIDILKLTGQWNDEVIQQFDLRAAVPDIQDYIITQLSGNAPTLLEEDAGYLTVAMNIVALIQPGAVSIEANDWLNSRFLEIPDLPVDIHYVLAINNILDLAEDINLDINEYLSGIRDYLSMKIVPGLSPNIAIMSDNQGTIEPMLTYKVLNLFPRNDVEYPNLQSLLRKLELRRVQNGWCAFISLQPSTIFTFYSMALAERMKIDNLFDEDKIKRYLISVMEQSEPNNTRDKFYAIRAYKSSWGNLPKSDRDELVLWVKNKVEDLSSVDIKENYTEILYTALIANELELKPAESFYKSLELIIEDMVENIGSITIKSIYELYLLDMFCKDKQVSTHENIIEQAVLSLRDNSGAFKSDIGSTIPDLDATYYAVWLLQTLGSADQVNKDDIIEFVEDCRGKLGFEYAPADLLSIHPEWHVFPELPVTVEALWLLDHL